MAHKTCQQCEFNWILQQKCWGLPGNKSSWHGRRCAVLLLPLAQPSHHIIVKTNKLSFTIVLWQSPMERKKKQTIAKKDPFSKSCSTSARIIGLKVSATKILHLIFYHARLYLWCDEMLRTNVVLQISPDYLWCSHNNAPYLQHLYCLSNHI